TIAIDSQLDEPLVALLYQDAGPFRDISAAQQRMCRTDSRVTRERKLGPRRKDPQPIIGRAILRLRDEGRLGKIRPVRDRLHLCRRKSIAIKNDRYRIAHKRDSSEDVHLLKPKGLHRTTSI